MVISYAIPVLGGKNGQPDYVRLSGTHGGALKDKKPLYCSLCPIVWLPLLMSNGHDLYGFLIKLVIDDTKWKSFHQFTVEPFTNGTPKIRHI